MADGINAPRHLMNKKDPSEPTPENTSNKALPPGNGGPDEAWRQQSRAHPQEVVEVEAPKGTILEQIGDETTPVALVRLNHPEYVSVPKSFPGAESVRTILVRGVRVLGAIAVLVV